MLPLRFLGANMLPLRPWISLRSHLNTFANPYDPLEESILNF